MHIENRIVVKVGTSGLLNGGTNLDQGVGDEIARQVADLRVMGFKTAVVSSGQVAAGRAHCRKYGIDPGIYTKGQLAGLGAVPWLDFWANSFIKVGLMVIQMPLTFRKGENGPVVWCDEKERSRIRANILDPQNAITVINENDVVDIESDEQIRLMEEDKNDNDTMSAVVARLIEARYALIISDPEVNGVYESPPIIGQVLPRRYEEIDAWNIPEHLRNGGPGKHGRGGIGSKIEASGSLAREGKRIAVASLRAYPNLILRFVRGENVGTVFGNKTVLCAL